MELIHIFYSLSKKYQREEVCLVQNSIVFSLRFPFFSCIIINSTNLRMKKHNSFRTSYPKTYPWNLQNHQIKQIFLYYSKLIDFQQQTRLTIRTFFLYQHSLFINIFYCCSFVYNLLMIQKVIGIFLIAGIMVALSYALGLQSRYVLGAPLIWLLNAYCFAVQIIIFLPSAFFKTQMFYDLTGSFTYLSTVAIALGTNSNINFIQGIAAGMIAIWALRLGIYLFKRVLQKGFDSRFYEMKQNAFNFFVAWYLQGLWTALTPCPLLVILSKNIEYENLRVVNVVSLVGFCIWLFGFLIEIIADYQKSEFNSKPENKGRFITVGLWSISRHPNYMGQITLWVGASIFAIPNLSNWEFFSLISPVFVYILITKASGVPLLEEQADKRWGNEQAYQQYKRVTPQLFPTRCNCCNKTDATPILQQ